MAGHQIAHSIVGVQQIARDLLAFDPRRQERKRYRRLVAALERERAVFDMAAEIDRRAIETGWRARLQAAVFEPERFQRFSEFTRRRFSRPAGWTLLGADMHQTVEERAGGDDQRAAAVPIAVLHRQTADPTAVCENPPGPSEQPDDVWLGLEGAPHPLTINPLVRLRARRPHRRTAAAVQQLELDSGRIDRPPHQTAERVDLAHQVALRGTANRRIARHVRNCFSGQCAQADACADPGGGKRRFASGMPGADDDDVEVVFHQPLLADAETVEDVVEQRVGSTPPRDLLEQAARFLQIRQRELL
jgi:hypothetical protein